MENNKYFVNTPIEGHYVIYYLDKKRNVPIAFMKNGQIGKAKNGRTIAIDEHGQITDVLTGSHIRKEIFLDFLKMDEKFFDSVLKEKNKAYKFLEDCGYIEEMWRIEVWGNVTKQDYEWAGINTAQLN